MSNCHILNRSAVFLVRLQRDPQSVNIGELRGAQLTLFHPRFISIRMTILFVGGGQEINAQLRGEEVRSHVTVLTELFVSPSCFFRQLRVPNYSNYAPTCCLMIHNEMRHKPRNSYFFRLYLGFFYNSAKLLLHASRLISMS